jgi:hypothetical protein
VTARFIFFRVYRDSQHLHSNTLVGWGAWVGIITVTWIFAFVLAELIPFFSEMLSTICSLFSSFIEFPIGRYSMMNLRSDGWFGFIYWAMAYLILYPGKTRWAGRRRTIETLFNYFLIAFGLYIFFAGTYVCCPKMPSDRRIFSLPAGLHPVYHR